MLDRTVGEIVGHQDLVRLTPDTSVADAVGAMARRHLGAVLICEGDVLGGIFTERDVLERVVAEGRDPAATPLSAVMTADPKSLSPEATALDAVRAMRDCGARHLPIVRDRKVMGIVSVRDVLRSVVEDLLRDNRLVEDLWDGFPV